MTTSGHSMSRSTLTRSLGLLLALMAQVWGQQHYLQEPTDKTVKQGQMAILDCVVGDVGGAVQWFKDGYGMGYGRDLPGHPRYSIIGNEAAGEYNLMITRTLLSDDSSFECQVGPVDGHPPLTATAHLHVQVPPETPEVEGQANGTQVEVPHQQKSVNLTCTAKGGKPAATLVWFKNGVEQTEDILFSTVDTGDKLQTAVSTMTIFPERSDNGALYVCRASNPASEGTVLQTTVQLSVMHPPNPPEITGYKTGEVVKTGETKKLLCVARGGNPPAQVHWYKNGKELDLSYWTGEGMAENELVMTIQPNDNNAVYKCVAKNQVTATPLTNEVKLTVQFGPEKMTITGREHAKVGETITLTCTSDISNPPAKITWSGQGQPIEPDSSIETVDPKGGFVTTSNVTVFLSNKQDSILYTCNGINEKLGKMATASRTLSVMYPPDQPVINGYEAGKVVEAESVLSMTCEVHGGNPLATVSWWKGSKQIESVEHVIHRIVSSRIAVTLMREDNLAEYRCNATNSATEEPLLDTVTLTVNYPPTSLDITTEPAKPSAGHELKVTCRSDASNPESTLTWWKNGKEVTGAVKTTTDAEYGGKATQSDLTLMPTPEDNAQIYECRATNKLLAKAVNDAIVLDVSYRPMFAAGTSSTFSIKEGHSGILNLTASANPAEVTYTWYKGDEKLNPPGEKTKRDVSLPHFVIDGGVLNITNVTRKDVDMYTCEASNDEGATNFTVKVDVQYQSEISVVSESVNVDHNTMGVLACRVLANPMPATITWTREGYNMSLVTETFIDGLAKLTVPNVTKEDSGTFVCTADNGVKEAVSAEAKLVVKYAPQIDRSQQFAKAAARNMETATVLCKAEGAPAVAFKWFRKNKVLDVSGIRYNEETNKDSIVQYTSSLQVFNVTRDDYGVYACEASNALGTDRHNVNLTDTSHPEVPSHVRINSTTHNSVTLLWTPGFDGGAPQRFRIRYRRVGREGYKTEEVTPRNATSYVVTGLSRATEYEFSVQAENIFGASDFAKAPARGRTAVSPLVQDDNIPLIIILTVSIFGMLLLGLNILLILFFYRRRRKKLEKDASEGASNANTVEMFSAPTITEDSKSYTTYDQSLDDFHNDYRIYDPEDELKRFLPPPTYSTTDLYRPPSSNLYGPPPHLGSAPHLGPPPHLGSAPHLGPAPYGPTPPFDPHRPAGPYDGRKYDPYGSVPRLPPQNSVDDSDDYANQLRALTKGLATSGTLPRPDRPRNMDQGPASLPPPSRVPPPLPPTRSSSKPEGPRSMPPLPSRNYGPEDLPPGGGTPTPRYAAPPGSAHNASPRPPSSEAPPPQMRGQLV